MLGSGKRLSDMLAVGSVEKLSDLQNELGQVSTSWYVQVMYQVGILNRRYLNTPSHVFAALK